MKRSMVVNAVFIMVLLFVVGCGSDSDKVQGIWKDTLGKDLLHTHFVEIGKNYIVVDGKREDGIVLVDIDGVVMVQTAGSRKDIMRLILHEDDSLTMELQLRGKQKLARSSKEEVAAKEKAVAEAKEAARKKAEAERIAKEKEHAAMIERNKQLVKDSYGTWVKMMKEDSYSNSMNDIYQVVVITEDSLTVNNETKPIHVSELSKNMSGRPPVYPALGYADNPKSYFFAIEKLEDRGNVMVTFKGGLYMGGDAKYKRMNPEDIRLHDNPSIDNIKGGWAKEGDSKDGYNVIAFSNDVFYCDGHSIKVTAKTKENSPRLSIMRADERYESVLRVVQYDENTIKVTYNHGESWHTYHKMENADTKKAMAKYTDKIKLLQGYWKSEKPVENDEYKYYGIVINKKDGEDIKDVIYSVSVDNKGEAGWVNTIESHIGYYEGKISEPFWCINNESAYYPAITVIDKNNIVCDLDRDLKDIKFKRVSSKDVPEKLVKKVINK